MKILGIKGHTLLLRLLIIELLRHKWEYQFVVENEDYSDTGTSLTIELESKSVKSHFSLDKSSVKIFSLGELTNLWRIEELPLLIYTPDYCEVIDMNLEGDPLSNEILDVSNEILDVRLHLCKLDEGEGMIHTSRRFMWAGNPMKNSEVVDIGMLDDLKVIEEFIGKSLEINGILD